MSFLTSRSRDRCWYAVSVAGLALSLAACGGEETTSQGPVSLTQQPSATAPPDASAVTSAAPAPTPTAPEETGDTTQTGAVPPAEDATTGTNTATGLAPPAASEQAEATGDYDDDPRIAAVERYAEEFARAASADDIDRPEWLATMTDDAQEQRSLVIEEDLGLEYPGPLPFTVTQVLDRDGYSVVEVCLMGAGFAIDPTAGAPGEQIVFGAEFYVTGSGDEMLVDGVFRGNNRCDNVPVEARTW